MKSFTLTFLARHDSPCDPFRSIPQGLMNEFRLIHGCVPHRKHGQVARSICHHYAQRRIARFYGLMKFAMRPLKDFTQ